MLTNNQKIWVIGNSGTKADKEISWYDSTIPHLADADILIIDLTRLTVDAIKQMKVANYKIIKEVLVDVFLNGGMIIVITRPVVQPVWNKGIPMTNVNILPFTYKDHTIAEGEKIVYQKHGIQENIFADYLKDVKSFNFYLEDFAYNEISDRATKLSLPLNIAYNGDMRVTDKAGHILGEYLFNQGEKGVMVFLPPTSKYEQRESINKIIDGIRPLKNEKTVPPSWISNVQVTGLQEKNNELENLQKEKDNIEEKIRIAEFDKQDLMDFTKLLYAKGNELEETVKNAFMILGIDNLTQIREDELEDGIFEFENSEIQYGVLEVKGSENRTTLAHLTQCNKWVEDYLLDDKKVKGIFIPNQKRLEEYPSSKVQKLHFEPNEIEYAATRKICIIPSCVLFEAVNEKLSGNGKSRKELEELILKTNGLLNSF